VNVSNGFKRSISILASLITTFVIGPKLGLFVVHRYSSDSPNSLDSLVFTGLFVPIAMILVGIISYLLYSNGIGIFFQKEQDGEQKRVFKPILISIFSVVFSLIGTILIINLLSRVFDIYGGFEPFIRNAGYLFGLGIFFYFLILGVTAGGIFTILVIIFHKVGKRIFGTGSLSNSPINK